MCYSANLSLLSFSFGLICSIYLYLYDKTNENIVIALFYIFVSLMQLIEYFLWKNINCTSSNVIISNIGLILNYLQPFILFLLCNKYLSKNNLIDLNIIKLINFIYIIYILKIYKSHTTNKKLCTTINSKNHLEWAWVYNFKNDLIYHFIMWFNIINFSNNKKVLHSIIVGYIFLLISFLKFKDNIGEFWCLLVTSVPLIMSFIQ